MAIVPDVKGVTEPRMTPVIWNLRYQQQILSLGK